MKKILVCVDFSVSSEPILEQAAKFAKMEGAKITLLHVAEPNPDYVGFAAGPEVVRVQMAEVYRIEHQKIQELAKQLADTGLAVSSELVQGATAETILAHADSQNADMIIMGTHGHGKLYHMILGSVSQHVLKKTKVPVLMVPVREE